MPGERSPSASSNLWRDIVVVVAVAWVARLAFMWLMPPAARSFDAFSWEHEAAILKLGQNPYQETNLFNWPPFWMQCVFVISKIASFLDVPFFRVLQVVLILFETAVMVVTVRLIQRLAPAANARALVIIGMALNPSAIFLICQHCNFDVIMVLWMLLAIASLMRYHTTDNLMDWLCACLFLGLGILTKTVPLALLPLLAGGFRKATATGRLLGAALALGPVTLGMSVIYVLSPAQVAHNVLGYRAKGFFSGFEGLLNLMDCPEFANCARLAFYALGIGMMALTWHHLWTRRSFGNRELALYTGWVLLLISGEGSGFSGEYFYWFLPFLVMTYACYGGLWRKLLINFGIVSAITSIINYGLIPAYGYNFLYLESHAKTYTDLCRMILHSHNAHLISLAAWSVRFTLPEVNTLVDIPLFISGVVLLVLGGRLLLNHIEGLRKKWVLRLAGLYALYILVIFAAAAAAKGLGAGNAGNNPPGDSNLNQTNHAP
jgi:hypothetical protein